MKIRSGFVSNSSSSSFVVLFSKNFDIKKELDTGKYDEDIEDSQTDKKSVIRMFKTLIKDGMIYQGEDDYAAYGTLESVVLSNEFEIVETASGGDGEGTIKILDQKCFDKIKKIQEM